MAAKDRWSTGSSVMRARGLTATDGVFACGLLLLDRGGVPQYVTGGAGAAHQGWALADEAAGACSGQGATGTLVVVG
ncbi:hypothetical protein [Streptomyces sp. NPDC004065]|uniref:hypothetical protein n=1 Tax=Streptomyces sp. NPDC004065 TaxID=3364689 RepID=UPI00384E22F4